MEHCVQVSLEHHIFPQDFSINTKTRERTGSRLKIRIRILSIGAKLFFDLQKKVYKTNAGGQKSMRTFQVKFSVK